MGEHIFKVTGPSSSRCERCGYNVRLGSNDGPPPKVCNPTPQWLREHPQEASR